MIENKADYLYYLDSDLTAHGISKWNWRSCFSHKILQFQRHLRKVEYYSNCKNDSYFWKMYRLYLNLKFQKMSINLGFTIMPNVFGPGLSIAHYGSIVVSNTSKVGKNCRIHSGVNIGSVDGKAPIIGDNVYIAPGAKLFGQISIGDNVRIGANAVVNKDIPSNVVVAGVPAKIIKHISN